MYFIFKRHKPSTFRHGFQNVEIGPVKSVSDGLKDRKRLRHEADDENQSKRKQKAHKRLI